MKKVNELEMASVRNTEWMSLMKWARRDVGFER